MRYIDTLDSVEVGEGKLYLNGHQMKLLNHYEKDESGNILIKIWRTYVPEFKFENSWEYLFATDDIAEDETVKTWKGRRTTTILDKKTRHPFVYSYKIDPDYNIYFLEKKADELPLEES